MLRGHTGTQFRLLWILRPCKIRCSICRCFAPGTGRADARICSFHLSSSFFSFLLYIHLRIGWMLVVPLTSTGKLVFDQAESPWPPRALGESDHNNRSPLGRPCSYVVARRRPAFWLRAQSVSSNRRLPRRSYTQRCCAGVLRWRFDRLPPA